MKPRRVAWAVLLLAVLCGTRAVSTETYKAGETFDAVLKTMNERAAKFNTEKIQQSDLANTVGSSDSAE